ncbi:hypothetical protein B7P43_G16279 [Cryptotermes secundus]|uniref:Tetraspanin n=1 Tax=Cryptotermes secundus TaxID=105785 RepID=A0A2J7Q6I8_9NEOP|nr:hypothetical protein B7P43_G16279 [Cryptotermes secundus]
MTVMLLQHTPLQYYKPPPPPSTSKDVTTQQQQHMNPPAVLHHHSISSASIQAFKASCNTRAMRYYRLWIYTCNAVLLVSVLGFAIVAGRIVVADPRSGLLQLVGCLGALRLNERLLNVYWLLLLVLLFGDAIVGIVWVFRFDKICADLRPTLKQRLAAEYGVDADFTTLWNALQRDYKCCGVDGAQDFEGGVVNRTHGVPESCCRFLPLSTTLPEAETNRVPTDTATSHRLPSSTSSDNCAVRNSDAGFGDSHVYTAGCEGLLLFWLRQSADVLFVLGYCVIAFVKLCFLGILRYEIREMIQKIKVLQGMITVVNNTTSPPPQIRHGGTASCGSERDRTGSGTALLLLQPPDSLQTTPLHMSTHHQRHLNLMNDGTDSDTNSNCALIISEDNSATNKSSAGKTKQPRGSNGNNNYELHELQELNRLLARHQTQI